jgi:replicative DNA helicase
LGLPANLDAEQAVLGAVLYDNDAWPNIEGLTAESFFDPTHRSIWQVIADRMAQGVLVEPVWVAQKLQADPGFIEMGAIAYLADLVDHALGPKQVGSFAAIVADCAARRSLIHAAQEMIAAAKRQEDGDAFSLIAEAESYLRDLARGSEPGDANLVDARSAVEELLEEFEVEAEHGRPKGLMTGLRCIDRRLRGLRPGHLLIIAGRPSMGKTALARQAAYGCAERNPHHNVAFFCLEMARREISERAMSELSYRHAKGDERAIPYQDMSGDKLPPLERKQLRDLAWRVPKNMKLDDTASLSVEYVRRRVWALKRRGPLAAIFIDYLQIMERPKSSGRNDAAVIGEMTSALKRLAREAEICVVLLSQINRGVESRDDKRPQLGDLRESGSIEQDANAVLFPFREVYYLERAEPKEGSTDHGKWEQDVENMRRRMDVACAKNRGGAVGSDQQEYFAEFDAISDIREEDRG